MVNRTSRKGNFKHDCYTCNKSAYVERYVLMRTDLCELHAPMGSRNKRRLTMTPLRHVSDISELGGDVWMSIYKEVKEFLKRYDVKGFEMTLKTGDWMRHDHQHTHIYLEDHYLNKILEDHFKPGGISHPTPSTRPDGILHAEPLLGWRSCSETRF